MKSVLLPVEVCHYERCFVLHYTLVDLLQVVDNFRIICLTFLLRFVKPDVLNIIYWSRTKEPNLSVAQFLHGDTVCLLLTRTYLSLLLFPTTHVFLFLHNLLCFAFPVQTNLSRIHGEMKRDSHFKSDQRLFILRWRLNALSHDPE